MNSWLLVNHVMRVPLLARRILGLRHRHIFLALTNGPLSHEPCIGRYENRGSRVYVSKSISQMHVTRARITPQTLRRLRRIELCFAHLEQGSVLGTLQSSLAELKSATLSPDHEVRWGILFLDAKGKEGAAMFLDSTGQFAEIGEFRLHVEGRTLACIRKIIDDDLIFYHLARVVQLPPPAPVE